MNELFGKNEHCYGCRACELICPKQAISMKPNEKGFLEPFVSKKCIDCGLCQTVCPNLNGYKDEPQKGLQSYVFKATERLREQSQSGGAFGALAEQFIINGGIVFGAVLDNHLCCRYIAAYTLDDVQKIKKSKYVQADTGTIYQEVAKALDEKNQVLFSGTPCHISGLVLFLKTCKVSTVNLYTVDIICHGVPSPYVFKDYISFFSKKHGNKPVESFSFRDKRFGWYGHVVISISNKQIVNDDYNSIFYSHYAHRDSCFFCKFANLRRIGDITVGDAWGIEKNLPEFFDDKGVSLVLVNSEKGKKLWTILNPFGEFQKVDINDYKQHNLYRPTEQPENLRAFWMDYKSKGFFYAINKYCFTDGEYKEYEIIARNQLLKRLARKVKNVFT